MSEHRDSNDKTPTQFVATVTTQDHARGGHAVTTVVGVFPNVDAVQDAVQVWLTNWLAGDPWLTPECFKGARYTAVAADGLPLFSRPIGVADERVLTVKR